MRIVHVLRLEWHVSVIRSLLLIPDGDPLTFDYLAQLLGVKVVPDQPTIEARSVGAWSPDIGGLAKPSNKVLQPADTNGLEILIESGDVPHPCRPQSRACRIEDRVWPTRQTPTTKVTSLNSSSPYTQPM